VAVGALADRFFFLNPTFNTSAPINSDFLGSATVSVASVGVPPTERCASNDFTRSVAVRAYR
jgi:hypothetical protein